MRILTALCLGAALIFSAFAAQTGQVKKAFIVRNNTEGPQVMAESGLLDILRRNGFEVTGTETIALTAAEEKEYGAWNRDALESRQIGKLVAAHGLDGGLAVGLLTNCVDLLGMLAGLQHLGPPGAKPLRVGLVYLDAHADFNTPETSLSGMLGGMDVAVATGLCLTRLRLKAGLDPALPAKYVVFGGLRDVDPLEQELLDRSDAEFLSVEDLRSASSRIDSLMESLGRLTDVIYIHIDMDVLDPAEVMGHSLKVPLGPTSVELSAAVERMFRHPKARAIGIASLPAGDRDKDGVSLEAAYRLIEGALKGYGSRF